jgi:hypothetical protein
VNTKKAIAGSLLLVCIGLILFANRGRLSGLWHSGASAEVLAEAKRHVPEPSLPAPPTGISSVNYEEKYVEVEVPEVTHSGSFWAPPQVTMRKQNILVGREPHVTLTPPSSDALRQWQAQTERMTTDYREDLREKISEIQRRREIELRESLKGWVEIMGGALASLISCITLFITLKKDRRESTPVEPRPSRLIIP